MSGAESNSNEIRLVKFLSTAGVASRRGAGDIVLAGRVTVNGKKILEPGFKVTHSDEVTCDGNVISIVSEKVYIMLNKPPGYTCSNADVHADKLAIDLIPQAKDFRLFSAGRLDKESQGLIIFSNDGDFVAKLTHPRHAVLKTYIVHTSRALSDEEQQNMRDGIVDEGEKLHVHSINMIEGGRYRIVLNEGKKREIRRLIRACGARTLRLKRTQIGNIKLEALPLGKCRNLTVEEVNELLK